MVALAGLACFTLARGGRAEAAVGGRRGEWIQLFNGRDLAGWTPKFRGCELGVNYNDTFRVENGVLKVCYDKYDNFGNRFGHLFHEGVFSHYLLRVEYRFVGEQVKGGPGWAFRNNGIMVHGERPQTIEKGGSFPASIEVQLLGGKGSGKRTTGNLCTPGTNVVMDGKLVTRHVVNSSSETYHGDQWVTILVEVRGNERIRHIIDGKVVLEYEKPQLDERDGHSRKLMEAGAKKMLDRGTISIQAESHPTEFRKIELLRLKH
jgi:hypothetical protein